MATDHNSISEQYKRSKQQPWRAYIEAFTLMELIGKPAGKSVVDITCGGEDIIFGKRFVNGLEHKILDGLDTNAPAHRD